MRLSLRVFELAYHVRLAVEIAWGADRVRVALPGVDFAALAAQTPCDGRSRWPRCYRLPSGLVFGPGFSELRAFVSALSLAIPGAALSQMYSTLFTMQGRLERSVGILVVMTITNIVGSLLLLPLLGPLGAALATAASCLISQRLYVLAQHRHLVLPRAPILLGAPTGWS